MANKDDEQVLVVKSEILFADGRWQGLKTDNLDYYVDLIRNNCEFRRRGDMETDLSYQQIISYILFNYQNKYFLYRYLKQAYEQRLMNDYIVGVGGHINKEDVKPGEDIIEAGVEREWEEEVTYNGNLTKKLVGILCDNRRPVERVHLGLVYVFEGDSPNISVKETDKMTGELVTLEDIKGKVEGINEGWAPLLYEEYLSKLIK
ncbi:MAG: hypothetical protein NTW11_02470 [Candidatus Staskawiczbacteria bacterium]|nr:hypothetical protein [Candidatus Staskawiczbacteria bacterium]